MNGQTLVMKCSRISITLSFALKSLPLIILSHTLSNICNYSLCFFEWTVMPYLCFTYWYFPQGFPQSAYSLKYSFLHLLFSYWVHTAHPLRELKYKELQYSLSILKSVLNVHWKDWCWSWSSNPLATWWKELTLGKDPDAGKDWGQEEKGTTEDEMAGWHHRLSGHEFE